jgi:hypothetical protein
MSSEQIISKYAPFIGGIVVLALGLYFHGNTVQLIGGSLLLFGVYHMVKTPKI